MSTPAPPLRVLHVVSSERFAGIERHVLLLAKGLRTRGVDCAIACPPRAARLRTEAAAVGVPVVPPDGTQRAAWRVRMAAACARRRPDVVHAHDGAAALIGWLVAAGGARLVRTQHFVRPASAARRGWRRTGSLAFHRALNAAVDSLVAVSASVAEATRARREIAREKVAVITPGIELPDEAEVRRAQARRRRNAEFVVAYVGRLEREKAPGLLLRAFALALGRASTCRLVVAGSGSMATELRGLARQLELAHGIDWLGEVGDSRPVLERAHVLVNPSSVEGFGLAVVEAMAWALPVIAVRAGGVAETVIDGETGLLVGEPEPASLAEAIERLAYDRALAERLGEAGRARAAERYDAARTVALTARLYERLRAWS